MWYEGPLGFLDYETTSPEPHVCRPVSFAVGVVDGAGQEIMPDLNRYELVNCDVPIPKEASQVHGITRQQVRKKGITPAKAVSAITDVVKFLSANDLPLVIFNSTFDWPLLFHERRRLALPVLDPRPAIIDPLVLDRHFDKFRKGKRTLTDLCRIYGIDLDDAHDALADCKAAVALARKLARKYRDIGRRDPSELQWPQRKMHREYYDQINTWRKGRNEEPFTYLLWPGVDEFVRG